MRKIVYHLAKSRLRSVWESPLDCSDQTLRKLCFCKHSLLRAHDEMVWVGVVCYHHHRASRSVAGCCSWNFSLSNEFWPHTGCKLARGNNSPLPAMRSLVPYVSVCVSWRTPLILMASVIMQIDNPLGGECKHRLEIDKKCRYSEYF